MSEKKIIAVMGAMAIGEHQRELAPVLVAKLPRIESQQGSKGTGAPMGRTRRRRLGLPARRAGPRRASGNADVQGGCRPFQHDDPPTA